MSGRNSNQALGIAAMVTLMGYVSTVGLTVGAVAAIGVLHILHSHSHGGPEEAARRRFPLAIHQRLRRG